MKEKFKSHYIYVVVRMGKNHEFEFWKSRVYKK